MDRSTEKPSLKHLDTIARLMDAQFRIPGTSFRFGLDAIIGLVPWVGDISTVLVSGYLLLLLAKNGASGFLLARMALNIVLDALIGSIPVVGDLFDFAFKANQRNMRLMHEHYHEGRHRGSAWKLLTPLLILVLLLIGGVIWASYTLFSWLIGLIGSW
jgi:hypothetical protein